MTPHDVHHPPPFRPQAYLEVERRAKHRIDDCVSGEEATSRFVRFIDLLLQPNTREEIGHARARELFHVIPQALKIDHIASRRRKAKNDDKGDSRDSDGDKLYRYDAIATVEGIVHDIGLLRATLGVNGPLDEAQLRPSRSHSLKRKSCGELIARDDVRVMSRYCDLFMADYACLGYQPPMGCATL